MNIQRIHQGCKNVGWPDGRLKEVSTTSEINDSAKKGVVAITDDSEKLISADLNAILEITGHPIAGSAHAVKAIQAHKHVVMVNVEADSMVGPLLSDMAGCYRKNRLKMSKSERLKRWDQIDI